MLWIVPSFAEEEVAGSNLNDPLVGEARHKTRT